MRLFLQDESKTLEAAYLLSQCLLPGLMIYLEGDLGAGKTTFCRGLMRGLGHDQAVKSPTFTVVEPYQLSGFDVYHCDLYRLSDPEELDYMGFEDYVHDRSICLVEWPDKGKGVLNPADVVLSITAEEGEQRVLDVMARSAAGRGVLDQFAGLVELRRD